MKNRIAFSLLTVLSLGTWLVAQRPPPGPPGFAQPNPGAPGASALTPAPLSTNQAEEMIRTLRRSMTNAPAMSAAPAMPGAATSVPTIAIPAGATPQAPSIAAPGGIPGAAVTTQQIPTPFPTPGLPTAPAQGQSPAAALPPALGAPVQQGPPGVAAPQAQVDQIIPPAMLQLQGMPLDQFLEIYSMVSGRTVLRPYQLQAKYQQITLKAETAWTRQEAIYAMDTVLALNQIAMIPIGEKFVKAVPFAEAALEGAELGKTNLTDSVQGEQFITKIVELKTAKPSELAQLLATFTRPNGVTAFDGNNTLVLRDYVSNVKRMQEVIEKVDVVRESDYKLEVIPIKYGKVEDLYNTMSSLISGQPGAAAVGSAAGTAGGGSRLGARGGGGYGRGGGGQYGGYGQQSMYRQPGQNYQAFAAAAIPQTAGAAQNTFQDRLRQIVSKAAGGTEVQLLQEARIVPDMRSNTLLIFANKRDIEMITNIVSKVDVLLAQVLIEAVILEVNLNDSQSLGVSMLQNPRRFGNDFTGAAGGVNNGQGFLNNITNLSSGLPGGFSYFGKLGGELEMAVSAIAREGTVNVISRPRVQTSHAIPGQFEFVEQVPYVTASYDNYYGGIGGGLGGSRSQVQMVPVGIQLYVTPFITPEGLVVMEIEQHASQRGADVVIDGNPIPVVNDRTASSTLTVRDGQSIMMGGFITESKNKSNSGVPVLKDIPGLGALFRSKNKSSSRSELVILMKATVLRTPEIAAEVAADEKAQLPGVTQAEDEFQKEDRKRKSRAKSPKLKPEVSAPKPQARLHKAPILSPRGTSGERTEERGNQ